MMVPSVGSLDSKGCCLVCLNLCTISKVPQSRRLPVQFFPEGNKEIFPAPHPSVYVWTHALKDTFLLYVWTNASPGYFSSVSAL